MVQGLLQRGITQERAPVFVGKRNAQDFERAFALSFTLFENPQIVPEHKQSHKIVGGVGVGEMLLAVD